MNDRTENYQTPKGVVGERLKEIRKEEKSRERDNSTTLIDSWAGKEENKKKMRQDEEKLEDIFKRSNISHFKCTQVLSDPTNITYVMQS